MQSFIFQEKQLISITYLQYYQSDINKILNMLNIKFQFFITNLTTSLFFVNEVNVIQDKEVYSFNICPNDLLTVMFNV